MLDIGWQELFLVSVLALIVIGPKDLPAAMRTVARVVRKARGLAREFQDGLDDMMRESELDEMRRQVEKASRFDVGGEVKRTVDPEGTLTEDFDPAAFNRELKDRVEGGPPTRPKSPTPSDPSDDDVAAATEPPEKSETPPAETPQNPSRTPTPRKTTPKSRATKKTERKGARTPSQESAPTLPAGDADG